MSNALVLSRRAFVLGTLGGLTTAVLSTDALNGAALAAETSPAGYATAWKLNTHWGYPRGAHGRVSCHCKACVAHAENKVFASVAEANNVVLRAHPGCLCVPQTYLLPGATYRRLFPPGTGSVDLRVPRVRRTIADRSAAAANARSEGGGQASGVPAAQSQSRSDSPQELVAIQPWLWLGRAGLLATGSVGAMLLIRTRLKNRASPDPEESTQPKSPDAIS